MAARQNGLLSRRAVLAALAAAPVAGAAGCGFGGDEPEPNRRPAATATGPARIVWGNWPEYLDVAEGAEDEHPTLQDFTKASGIQVDYREAVNANEDFVQGIRPALEAGKPPGYDVMALTGWMASQVVRQGWTRPLDLSVMPNAGRVLPALARPDWDPEQRMSRPWQAGLTGIAYNAAEVERPVFTINDLLTRPDLKGRVGLLSEFNDAVGMVMLGRGSDPADFVDDEAQNALDDIAAARRNGHVSTIAGNDYIDRLVKGDIVASLVWSGDALQAQSRNPYIKFVVPEEGMMIWADFMLIPAGSPYVQAVSKLIDWYYQPDVAAKVARYVNYICPVEGAREAMARLDPTLADSPLIFPDDDLLDRSHVFASMAPDVERRLRRRFTSIIASA